MQPVEALEHRSECCGCYSVLAYGCQCNLSTNAGLDRRVIVVIKELLQLGVQPESLVDGAVHDPMTCIMNRH